MIHQHVRRRVARPGALAAIACVLAGALACTAQPANPAATAVISPTAPPAAHALNTVRSGSAGVMGEAGQQLAQAQGYFAQEGVAVNFVKVDASTVFSTLIAGQVDVQGLGLEAGVFSALSRGVEFRIVATQATSEPNGNGVFFVVRKDLIESGKVHANADLKGLKIAVPSRGSTFAYVVAKASKPVG